MEGVTVRLGERREVTTSLEMRGASRERVCEGVVKEMSGRESE